MLTDFLENNYKEKENNNRLIIITDARPTWEFDESSFINAISKLGDILLYTTFIGNIFLIIIIKGLGLDFNELLVKNI